MTSWNDRPRLILDLETYSSADITKTGAFKYVEAPDFEILLLAYAWGDGPVTVLELTEREPNQVWDWICDPNVVKVAHNSAFERACLSQWLDRDMPAEEWEDTMILAAMNGLPMSLDAAGAALQLTDQKLTTGKALINYFCKPCKPTIRNGGRTRNLPTHEPEKWAQFIEYCKRDVEVEQTIWQRLRKFPIPEWERKLWAVDARINERGVTVDTELAEAAIHVDDILSSKHSEELRQLTHLDNPNSVAQLKDWLENAGVVVDSLNKTTVGELRKTVPDPTTRRVLELRQLLGKTSTKKYETMLTTACTDNRIRGLLQYYGAGRTGRWAGRLVQVQNLPQNHLDDIALVRELVRDRDLDTLELLYDSVPDVLSQLIRTAFIAKPAHTFVVCDYSAIEARVIAYLAGEKWRMDVFAQGGDIYCSSASQMFKVPVEKHGVNGHLRAKGKVAELACIAEGQKVLTDRGLIPIEKVTTSMKIWDGIEWVSHEGVICRGDKEVISYGGLEATPDHIVWAKIAGKPRAVYFGCAAASGAHLIQTGADRCPIWVGGDNQCRKAMEPKMESLLCADAMCGMRRETMAGVNQFANREIKGMSELFPKTCSAEVVIQTAICSKTALYEPERCQLQKLWKKRDRISLQKCKRCLPIYDRNPRNTSTRDGTGSYKCQRTLRTGKFTVGDASRELCEPKEIYRKVKVYDILNAGPRHRFTVSNVLVHNCGYGGGVGALRAFGADKMGLTEAEMQDIVTQWRQASPTIPKFWRDAERAARTAIEYPGRTTTLPCGVKYVRDADALRCRLPSGRVLSYWGARIENGEIVFMGQNQTTRKWEKTNTWGGKLVENIVQAFARDCLAVAILRLEEAGYAVTFHVHDEVIVEVPDGSHLANVAEIMSRPLDWAPGLLLKGEGYVTPFYMKD